MTVGSLAGKYLEAAGVTVRLLQSENLAGESPGYPCVTQEANLWLADVFVSIHCNAARDAGTARGAETYCYWEASEAGQLASCIQRQVFDTQHAIDAGFLVEIGFIDHPADAWLMANHADDIARAVARGVTDFELIR